MSVAALQIHAILKGRRDGIRIRRVKWRLPTNNFSRLLVPIPWDILEGSVCNLLNPWTFRSIQISATKVDTCAGQMQGTTKLRFPCYLVYISQELSSVFLLASPHGLYVVFWVLFPFWHEAKMRHYENEFPQEEVYVTAIQEFQK